MWTFETNDAAEDLGLLPSEGRRERHWDTDRHPYAQLVADRQIPWEKSIRNDPVERLA
jgi:hypothetical protein